MNTQDFKRKLTAVFSADVAGYSRLMGEDEAATVKILEAYKQVMSSLIKQHRGRVIDSPGDNLLAEFASVVDAVQCGVAVQKELQARNADLPENRKMQFRIGINLGDVIEEQDRIYGDGVNIAARLESCADPGGICVSKTAFDHIETKLPLGYEYLGEKEVKNIAKPVGAYRVLMEPRVTVVGAKDKKPPVPVFSRKKVFTGAVALLVVIIGAAVWNFYWRAPKIEPASISKMAFPLPDKPSIAVLPFDNISGDREQDYIADGITENIISYLSKHAALFVIDRKSSSTYKGKHVKVQQVSEDLGVRFILEGSVQKSGNKLRVTAQLVDALKGQPLWSERYDRDFHDLFALQDEITTGIQKAMGLQLTGEHLAILYGTTNLEAWGYMVREITPNNLGTKEGALEARSLCEKAAQLDPSYGYAWNQLAWTYVTEAMFGGWTLSPAESLKRATEYAQKEEATGKARGGYHTLMNAINFSQRKYDEAIAEGEKAIAMEPNSAVHYARLATALRYAGRPDEAIANSKKAMRLNPYHPAWYLIDLAAAYLNTGQYTEALVISNKYLERSLKGEGSRVSAHVVLAITYARLGQMETAKAHVDEIVKMDPKYTVELYRKTTPYKDRAYVDDLASLLIKAGLPEKPPLPLPDKPSIAVLPFVNMSDDPQQEYFSDGLTEQIITTLSRYPRLFVIARQSSFYFKGKSVKVQQVAGELGVRYVLQGSVQRSGDKVRITAQLIDATTGRHVWSERYDRELKDVKDIFALQDEITIKVMNSMSAELTEGDQAQRWTKGKTDNLKALEKMYQGWAFLVGGTKEDNEKARQLFEEAIALDPKFLWPQVALGYAHYLNGATRWSESPSKSFQMAFELAQKAIAIDDSDDRPHSLLSYVYLQKRQYDNAFSEAERAVNLNPNGAEAYFVLASIVGQLGRWEESVLYAKKAMRLNPFPGNYYYSVLGRAYFHTGQYNESIVTLKNLVAKVPDMITAHLFLAACYSSLGRDSEAAAAAKEVLRIDPKFSIEIYAKVIPYKNNVDIEREVAALRKAGLK